MTDSTSPLLFLSCPVLSCTNLDAVAVSGGIARATRLPVLSRNLVLAWHMGALAGIDFVLHGDQRPA